MKIGLTNTSTRHWNHTVNSGVQCMHKSLNLNCLFTCPYRTATLCGRVGRIGANDTAKFDPNNRAKWRALGCTYRLNLHKPIKSSKHVSISQIKIRTFPFWECSWQSGDWDKPWSDFVDGTKAILNTNTLSKGAISNRQSWSSR